MSYWEVRCLYPVDQKSTGHRSKGDQYGLWTGMD